MLILEIIATTFHTSIPVTRGICPAQHLCMLEGKPVNEQHVKVCGLMFSDELVLLPEAEHVLCLIR